MADVFISCRRAERSRVEQTAERPREVGPDVWYDARLDVASGEGFDAEIDREVASAACVVVCRTPEALKPIDIRAGALEGLEGDVLRPVFLEPCAPPVPFNAIDTADLSRRRGENDTPAWQRVVSSGRACVEASKADAAQRRAQSRAAYARTQDQIFPGTLAELARRIAAIRECDAEACRGDILAVVARLESVGGKKARHTAYGYEPAERRSGGDAWRRWDRGGAAPRAAEIAAVRTALGRIVGALARSRALLDRPAP